MNKGNLILYGVVATLALVPNANATVITISDVPAYDWYHGCGPTAAASIIGYYDQTGYDGLFDASGWDDVRLTANVRDEISSPAHNTKYDSHPDAPGAAPPDTSIADFFHTSEGIGFGWSYLSYADDAFVGYANYRGYGDWSAWSEWYGSGGFTWADLTNEIDNNRPLMFLVDTNGDRSTDHFVPVIGYDDANMRYGAYTTWSEEESISWFSFQGMGNRWGVGYATFVQPGIADEPVSIPEPSTLTLFVLGLLGLGLTRLGIWS